MSFYVGLFTQLSFACFRLRASPPAASMSPDRNGCSLPMFSSSSTTHGLSINNGNGGDSSTQSTSSSPSLFSSSLPNGGGPPVEIPQFGSTKALNGDATTTLMTTGSAEIDVDNDDERSTTKSPLVDEEQKEEKELEIFPQQPACNSGMVDSKRTDGGSADADASKLSALFSKLLCGGDEHVDLEKFLGGDIGKSFLLVWVGPFRLAG